MQTQTIEKGINQRFHCPLLKKKLTKKSKNNTKK